jgi:hypothetical protein
MKNIFIYGSTLLFFLGCVEPFDLELDKVKARLVVQGLIENNAGPHYIRLIKSNPGLNIEDHGPDPRDSFWAIVKDATVIITDDFGQTETLELIPKKDELDPYDNYQEFGGFYKTSNFIGVPGRTYFLKIITKEGEIYTASDYMHPISEIDSIKFQRGMGDIGKPDDYVPILYFKDPQENEENRYLVQLEKEEYMKIGQLSNQFDLWEFAILSDKYFQPGKTGVSIDNGAGPRDWSWYRTLPGDLAYIRMNSLSDQSYTYYKFLLEQFQQDGGAYKPSPASPPTNISNGGLGFFRASAVAEAEAIVE